MSNDPGGWYTQRQQEDEQRLRAERDAVERANLQASQQALMADTSRVAEDSDRRSREQWNSSGVSIGQPSGAYESPVYATPASAPAVGSGNRAGLIGNAVICAGAMGLGLWMALQLGAAIFGWMLVLGAGAKLADNLLAMCRRP